MKLEFSARSLADLRIIADDSRTRRAYKSYARVTIFAKASQVGLEKAHQTAT